ncbi:MAG: sigma-70 family RNA polymerase sigma factor [Colwellia sp.]|nr:sigma-70 family RNA polymerase sigma factor [Colwellia sp.]
MLQAEEDLLVIAAQSGNHKAFNVLVLKYQKSLLRFAYQLSNDAEMAHDAVQDCWIKSTKNLHQLNDPRAFKSWLYRLVKWRVTDLIRIKVKHQMRITNEFDEQLSPYNEVNKDNQYEDGVGKLTKVIRQLPTIEKQIIHLFYLDEMSLAEVAIVLAIPVGTVKSRLNRARKLLKQKLALA